MRGVLGPLTKLGIFVVVTVVFTAVLGLSIANVDLGSTKAYKARFSDATMLLPGDDVRIAGVRVGQVADVHIADRRQAEVDFEVEAGRTLPKGVIATIKFRNLVGQRYVSLEQGSGQPAGDLEQGGNIPIERTKPAVDLTELFNGFKPLFRALNPDDVNKLSYEIVQVLQGEGGTVESLLSHTASLTTTIAQKDRVIGQVIDNLNQVLATINQRTPQLSQLIDTLQRFVSGLASDREPIGQAIESIGGLADTTAGLLDEAREPLKKDIGQLGRLAGNLNDSESVVEQFIRFLPVKAKRMSATADYGSWFNFFLCETKGTVTLPGTGTKLPITLAPTNRERCVS